MSTRNWTELKYPEKRRTYHYTVPSLNVTITGVKRLAIDKTNGYHYVDGDIKGIIPPGWLYITFEADGWTF